MVKNGLFEIYGEEAGEEAKSKGTKNKGTENKGTENKRRDANGKN